MTQIEEISTTVVEPEVSVAPSSLKQVTLSIVVPVMNEELNVRPLFEKLSAQLAELNQSHEVIFVDDGSTDKTFEELKKLYDENRDVVRVIRFRRHFGKTPALVAGFSRCRREIIEDTHVKLYGEFHRFVPVMAHWRGFRIAEIKVKHHPRIYGVSKFGARRFVRGLIDMLNVLFLPTFLSTSLRFFGLLGFWTFLLGA